MCIREAQSHFLMERHAEWGECRAPQPLQLNPFYKAATRALEQHVN